MKRTVLFVVLLFLLPSVHALNIEELEFLEFYSHGNPIGAVSTGQVPNIDLKVVISGDDFTGLQADLSDLNRNQAVVESEGYADMSLDAEDCDYADETYTCYFRNLVLLLPGSEVAMPFTLFNSTDSVEILKMYVFDIDDTAPVITSIKPDTCLDDYCFIASDKYSTFIMEFEDSKATFEKKLVRFNLDGSSHFVYNCTDMTCYGRAKTECDSGEMVMLKILSEQTMDDAYNKVSNNLRDDVVCDADAPSVTSYTVANNDNKDYVVIGDTMIITLNVTENLGEVSIEGNFSEFMAGEEEGECVNIDDDEWQCTISPQVFGEDAYTGTAYLTITDTAGNEIEYEVTQDILGINSEIIVDEWTVGNVEGMPNVLNTQVVEQTISDIKVYYSIPLLPKYPDLEALDMSLACQAPEGEETVFGAYEILNSFQGSTNPFIVGTVYNSVYDPGTYKMECVLAIHTRNGQYVHAQYEYENITIEIELLEGEDSVDKVIGEVNHILNDDFLFSDTFETMLGLNKMFQLICNGASVITTAVQGYNAIASETSEFPPPPASGPNDATSTLDSTLGFPVCGFATCKLGMNNAGDNLADLLCEQLDFAGEIEVLEALGGMPCEMQLSGKNSIIIALANACLPDILYNLEKFRTIKINYADCLMNEVPQGTASIADCQATRGFLQCKYLTGQIFNIIPHIALLKETLNTVKNVVRNPVALGFVGVTYACDWLPGFSATKFCQFAQQAITINKVIRYVFQQIFYQYQTTFGGKYVDETKANLQSQLEGFQGQ